MVQVSHLHLKAMLNAWEGFRKELQEQSRIVRAAIYQGMSRTQQMELVVGRSRQQLKSNVWWESAWSRADEQLARSTAWVLQGKRNQMRN